MFTGLTATTKPEMSPANKNGMIEVPENTHFLTVNRSAEMRKKEYTWLIPFSWAL